MSKPFSFLKFFLSMKINLKKLDLFFVSLREINFQLNFKNGNDKAFADSI